MPRRNELGAHQFDAVLASEFARLYVEKRLPLDRAYAFGSTRLTAGLSKLGIDVTERTVRNWRAKRLGAPVGQLPAHGPMKSLIGANTYDPRRFPTELRQLFKQAVWALSVRRPRRDRSEGVGGGAYAHIRARGALEWAIRSAEIGRNNVGYRLVLLLRRIGLELDEVEEVLRDYQQDVCALKGHAYTWAEARSTLRSAFRRSLPEE